MTASNTKITTIDEYIATFPSDVQGILTKIRVIVRSAAPDATETIGYGIPTFKLHDKNLVHFGAYDHHIGFYPTPNVMTAFENKLSKYITAKGSVQFPLNAEIPYDLIKEMTEYRITHF